jgi:hypothetical protein
MPCHEPWHVPGADSHTVTLGTALRREDTARNRAKCQATGMCEWGKKGLNRKGRNFWKRCGTTPIHAADFLTVRNVSFNPSNRTLVHGHIHHILENLSIIFLSLLHFKTNPISSALGGAFSLAILPHSARPSKVRAFRLPHTLSLFSNSAPPTRLLFSQFFHVIFTNQHSPVSKQQPDSRLPA